VLLGFSSDYIATTVHQSKTQVTIVEVKDLRQTVAFEIGYRDTNALMIRIKCCLRIKSDCYVCTTGRPESQVVPFALGWSSDPDGMYCMFTLFQDAKAWGKESCWMLSLLFPEVRGHMGQPLRTIRPPTLDVNYTPCLTRQGVRLTNVGNLTGCSENRSFNSFTNRSTLLVGRADFWWYFGGPLFETLPGNWAGTCALEQLAIPFTLAFRSPAGAPTSRKRRDIDTDTAANRRGSFDPHVYIGVPRGVPNEFKARNQIEAGFESVFFWWSTMNKNVYWVNYIYYNQQRFVNYTRDAIKGIAEQLGPTSQMAWENRLALGMMLAEKGGVCIVVGVSCCTYIPNNTAPDETTTKALQGLMSQLKTQI
jgi:hypothetical protein